MTIEMSQATVCEHVWEETSSEFYTDNRIEVRCSKCGMIGEMSLDTGYVYYPAT